MLACKKMHDIGVTPGNAITFVNLCDNLLFGNKDKVVAKRE